MTVLLTQPVQSNHLPRTVVAPEITVEVFRAPVGVTDKDTGELTTIWIPVRRVFVTVAPIVDSGHHKLTCTVRGNTVQYSVHLQERIHQNPWQNPECWGTCKAWYKLGDWKRTNKDPMSELGALQWLTRFTGNTAKATAIMQELTDGIVPNPEGSAPRKAKKERKPVGKCACGRGPIWCASHTGQCFRCTPAQV